MAGKVEELVGSIMEGIIDGTGYELVDVEYKKEGLDWYLRVFIDHPDGVNLDTCERFSRQLGEHLDKEDPVPHSYLLEISSPGIERPLKKDGDFVRFAGYKVAANTYTPIDGAKSFQGKLLGLEDGAVVIQDGDKKWIIPKDKIASIHLSPDL